MRQVGNRAMPILEIKRIQELFGPLALISASDSFIVSDEREYFAIA